MNNIAAMLLLRLAVKATCLSKWFAVQIPASTHGAQGIEHNRQIIDNTKIITR